MSTPSGAPLYLHPACLLAALVGWGVPAVATLAFVALTRQPAARLRPSDDCFQVELAVQTACASTTASKAGALRAQLGLLPTPAEFRLLALIAAFAGCAGFCHNTANNLLIFVSLRNRPEHGHASDFLYQDHLADFGFELVPVSHCTAWVEGVIKTAVPAWPLALTALLLARELEGAAGLCLCTAMHFLFKQTIQLVTLEPAAQAGCWFRATGHSRGELEAMADDWRWMFHHFPKDSCADMMYSGHVATAWVALLHIRKYLAKHGVARAAANVVVPGAVFALSYSLIACRVHYTADVLMALFVGAMLHSSSKLQAAFWKRLRRAAGEIDV